MESVKDRILKYKSAALEQATMIRSAESLTEAFVQEHLYLYIKRKFLLDDDECTCDGLTEITEISIAKAARISKNLVAALDISSGCDGVSSATSKKVLLLMAMQKDLGITLPPTETAKAQTVSQLALLVFSLLEQNK